jgi:hypothetical protein
MEIPRKRDFVYLKTSFHFTDCTGGFEPGVQSTSGNFFSNPLPRRKLQQLWKRENQFKDGFASAWPEVFDLPRPGRIYCGPGIEGRNHEPRVHF